MKKNVSLILTLILCMSIVVLPVLADDGDDTFTKEDAKKLFTEAYNCYYVVQQNTNKTVDENGFGYRGYNGADIIRYKNNEKKYTFEKSLDGKNYLNLDKKEEHHVFFEVTIHIDDRNIETYSELMAYIKSIYDDTMAKRLLTLINTFVDDGPLDFYRPGENDELLINHTAQFMDNITEKCDGFTGDFIVNGNKAELGVYVNLPIIKYNDNTSVSSSEYKKNIKAYKYYNSKYDLIYVGEIMDGGTDMYYVKLPTTVEFTKTENGWRFSGGNFFETYKSAMYLLDPPPTSTGDSSPAVVGLALAALVSLAAPFVVKRRR